MGVLYDYLSGRNGVRPHDGVMVRVTGDRGTPLMDALLDLHVRQPKTLEGLIEVIPTDGELPHIQKVRRFQQRRRDVLDDLSQFLQDKGYEAASKYLDCYYEL